MQTVKTAWVGGGNGFIGHWLARRLRAEGYWVRVVDIKHYEYGNTDYADEIVHGDLRDINIVRASLRLNVQKLYSYYELPYEEIIQFDEVYCFACLMGGAGFVFTGENDSEIMHDSALINLNILDVLRKQKFKGKVFYSSSACMYPQGIQNGDPDYVGEFYGQTRDGKVSLSEDDAYPANPDSEYGWEKLFSERLFLAYQRNHNLNVRIARFHNIYGPEGTYKGGKEKAPAAMCRKVIECKIDSSERGSIDVWGDGNQTRSFLFIEDCIDAVRLLMVDCVKDGTTFYGPVNIGSEEMVSINELANMAIGFSGKEISIDHIDGPQGVRGRNSDNTLIRSVLGWEPKYKLKDGLRLTFDWIKSRYDGNI